MFLQRVLFMKLTSLKQGNWQLASIFTISKMWLADYDRTFTGTSKSMALHEISFSVSLTRVIIRGPT